MGEAYRMGLMHGQFDSMTQGERMELRTVQRLVRRVEEQLRLLVLTGTTWPEQAEPVRLRWPDVPDAKWERHCHGWGCTKKVPAGRLVCPWCGRMETAPGFGWMDALYAPRETGYMGNGACKTVFRPTGRDDHRLIMEQYNRSPVEAIELKAELVTEVPVETVRALLEELGVAGDS